MANPQAEGYEALPPPTSLEDVETLVKRLYLPGSPSDIGRIQHALQNIQKSPEGWALADALLQSQDPKVRFFGALTFTIKINTDWASLGNESPNLLGRLLLWLVKLVVANEGPLVVRKLCSALVAFYIQPTAPWKRCIRHVLLCFHAGTTIDENEAENLEISANMFDALGVPQMTTTIWFATALVEEASKMSSDTLQTHKCHGRIAANIEDIVHVLEYSLSPHAINHISLAQESIKSFQSWVMYVQRAYSKQEPYLQLLRSLTPKVIRHLQDPELFEVSQEFLSDVLMNFPSFFTANDYGSLISALCNPMVGDCLSDLRNGDFEGKPMALGRLLLAFGDAAIQDLLRKTDDAEYVRVLNHLVSLLMCDGYAVVEDEICSQALEFWLNYLECMLMSTTLEGTDQPAWMVQPLQYVMRVVEACWNKARMPPDDIVTEEWDQEARTGFKSFRADVEEILISSYLLLGLGLFERFAQLALDALTSQAWYHLEATLFCLNALSETIAHEDTGDQTLLKIFSSDLFTSMTKEAAVIPAKCRQTAVTLIFRYTPFFDRHIEYQTRILNFLFSCLKTPDVANQASKAIHAICFSCPGPLIPQIDAFLKQYDTLLSWSEVESGVREKVIGAIAAIIQALSTDEAKVSPLDQLLEFVQMDVENCLLYLRSSQIEDAKAFGLSALECLVSIGRAMQVPDKVPVELDEENVALTIWEQEPGQRIQSKIISLYHAVISSPLQCESDIVRTTCLILRTGYKEMTPGPFVFAPTQTADLMTSCVLTTPSLGVVLETTGMMLSRHKSDSTEDMRTAALRCFHHCLQLISAIGNDPSDDPDVASSCIDLVDKLIPRRLHTFFDSRIQPMLSSFFELTLQCLTVAEILPKRSSAKFWKSFLEVEGQPTQTQNLVDASVEEYGPRVAHALIRGIGGQAARSELDTLSDPLKKMVFRQPRARLWLSEALHSETFPSQHVGDRDKKIWLQKIMNLRGARGTNQVVKEFWMECRGTNLSFAS